MISSDLIERTCNESNIYRKRDAKNHAYFLQFLHKFVSSISSENFKHDFQVFALERIIILVFKPAKVYFVWLSIYLDNRSLK
jgi:hypothetical protein